MSLGPDDIDIRNYAGAGYAKSRPEELDVIRDAARRGGLVLDPVYTGKAYFGMMDLVRRGEIGADENVLFFHTGGLLGLLAKAEIAKWNLAGIRVLSGTLGGLRQIASPHDLGVSDDVFLGVHLAGESAVRHPGTS